MFIRRFGTFVLNSTSDCLTSKFKWADLSGKGTSDAAPRVDLFVEPEVKSASQDKEDEEEAKLFFVVEFEDSFFILSSKVYLNANALPAAVG